MNYQQTVDYLFNRHQTGIKLGLERMCDLMNATGHPESCIKTIHIAGTNGKGSTAAMIASILQAAGYRTGLYTSPHLIDMRERIQINGNMITESEVMDIMVRLIPSVEASNATFFEILTAMAFLYFYERQVDIAVVETGLGGRLDATNVLNPELTIVTEIGLDHTKILGKTLRPIAAEKAGIFKSGVPCIIGSRIPAVNEFFKKKADEVGCPAEFARSSVFYKHIQLSETGTHVDAYVKKSALPNLKLRLLGGHQLNNMATALLAVTKLNMQGWRLKESDIREGLKQVQWPGRLDLLQSQPKILLDSAHNPLGVKHLVQSVKKIFSYDRLILVFGVLGDKNYNAMMKKLLPVADDLILTQPNSERALAPAQLEPLAMLHGKTPSVIPEIGKAWNKALLISNKDDLICGTGSLYLIGELLKIYRNKN